MKECMILSECAQAAESTSHFSRLPRSKLIYGSFLKKGQAIFERIQDCLSINAACARSVHHYYPPRMYYSDEHDWALETNTLALVSLSRKIYGDRV